MRVVAWALAGLAYGVLLRLWMRFVSSDPEFSWSGTLTIVGIFTVLGLMTGLVGLGRRRGWHRRLVATRIAGGVLALPCFMAAGSLMFPVIVPMALGVARTDWRPSVRLLLVAVGVVVAALIVVDMENLGVIHRLVAFGLFVVLSAFEVLMLSRILRPSLPAGSLPRSVRIGFVVAPVLVALMLVVAVVGVRPV